MNTVIPKYLRTLMVLLSLLLLTAPASGTLTAYGSLLSRSSHEALVPETSLAPERAAIVSVLNNRIEDPRLLARAKDKLSVLQDREIRLISSLCKRILESDQSAGVEIAFSLVTALIILS
jgi:hypothetical protein